MAKNTADVAAAKAKKQKIILIVGGVLLLGVAAIQGPKLMKKDSQPDAVPAATSGPWPSRALRRAPPAPRPEQWWPQARPRCGQAGRVRRRRGASPCDRRSRGPEPARVVHALRGQGSVRPAGGRRARGRAAATVNASGQAPAAGTDGSGRGHRRRRRSGDPGSAQAAAPLPVVYATINLDGKPQQLKVKQKFPEGDPLFVLRSLTKKQAKIGVAGGSFDDGQAVTLQFGKKVTLVNTATGVRYELKLVYTGTTPETIEGFTTGQGAPRGRHRRLPQAPRPQRRRPPRRDPRRAERRQVDAAVRLQRYQRPGCPALGRDPGIGSVRRPGGPARRWPARRADRGDQGRWRSEDEAWDVREEGGAEVAAGLLAPVRHDDRGGPVGRHRARDPRAADRRPRAWKGDRRRARAGRVGCAPVGGDGEASGRVQPPVHRHGRGRRGRRCARHGARPRRGPDRERAEDQAPGQGRDDLPECRARLRDPRDDRNADVPRPDLRQDLRPARRRAADADQVRDVRLECAASPVVPGDPDPGCRVHRRRRVRWVLRVPPLEEDRGRPGEVGYLQACASRFRSAPSSARSRWRAGHGRSRR